RVPADRHTYFSPPGIKDRVLAAFYVESRCYLSKREKKMDLQGQTWIPWALAGVLIVVMVIWLKNRLDLLI
ncbi:hypothetical protein P0G10_19930, partial [Eubacteriales bacterium DFI.9.88]|nr:hypothetical protein [Eubacteriales bacterium DFI.9.88]